MNDAQVIVTRKDARLIPMTGHTIKYTAASNATIQNIRLRQDQDKTLDISRFDTLLPRQYDVVPADKVQFCTVLCRHPLAWMREKVPSREGRGDTDSMKERERKIRSSVARMRTMAPELRNSQNQMLLLYPPETHVQ